MNSKVIKTYDCIIIGAGPSGLTAGIYLGRFLRSVLIVDNNLSRAKAIPVSHNLPGFINGISGKELLALLLVQYKQYGNKIIRETVKEITKNDKADYFEVKLNSRKFYATKIILATGLEDKSINIPGIKQAKKLGLVRECPVCDAYEYRNKSIAIIGKGEHAINEAVFLSHYSKKIFLLLSNEQHDVQPSKIKQAADLGINVLEIPHSSIKSIKNNQKEKVTLVMSESSLLVDVVYLAMGISIRSELAVKLGAEQLENSGLLVDDHQETNIHGLYATGDAVKGLKQISVAIGHGAIAATDIHNNLPNGINSINS